MDKWTKIPFDAILTIAGPAGVSLARQPGWQGKKVSLLEIGRAPPRKDAIPSSVAGKVVPPANLLFSRTEAGGRDRTGVRTPGKPAHQTCG